MKHMRRSFQLVGLLLLCHSTLSFGAEGNAVAGKAKAEPCAACHGQTGVSENDLYPSIAGQGFNYLLDQLKALQDGTRDAPLMAGQLASMSNQDLLDIAAFYASQTAVLGGSDATDSDLLTLGEQIYRGGVMSRGITACIACHSPRGNGNSLAGFPRLSGQLPAYTVQALKDYRNKARGNSANGLMMQQTAEWLSDKEIEALANYIYGLH